MTASTVVLKSVFSAVFLTRPALLVFGLQMAYRIIALVSAPAKKQPSLSSYFLKEK